MVQLHPMGILLGLVFVFAVGSLFVWMFRVPPVLPLPVVKVRHSLQAIHKILVPVGETIPSQRAVELACRLGHDQKAELVLVHVITVPFTLSLDAALPVKEKEAHQALELASVIANQYGLHTHTRILRDRHAANGVLRVAQEEEVDAIVLGVGIKRRTPGSDWGQTTAEIVTRALCEVIVDKVPMEAQPFAA